MKLAEKNLIDLLLRQLAKDPGSAPVDAEMSTHLDADELNAYAEDALPALARTRHTKHLIDCSNCRNIVTQLTLASGRKLAEERPTVHSSFWSTLQSFFSPPFLRLAAPVLATLIIVAIGFIVLRQTKESDFIAENRSAEQVTEPEQSPGSTSEVQETQQGNESSQAERTKLQRTEQRTATAETAGSKTASDPRTERVATPVESAQPSFAPEPKPDTAAAAAPPPPAVNEDLDAKSQTVAQEKNRQAAKDEEFRKRDDFAIAESEERNRRGNQSSKPSPLGRVANAPARAEARAEDKKETESSGQGRSVSGRQFRREGGVWVDTAYVEGRAATVIRRGSEQYRALVADEPGIKQIAEELHGAVIVVWKGRIYKLQ